MKKNNKGFTLIELIIAISILGIVTTIGYTTLNNTNNSISEQKIVTAGQLDINLVNKYLTKDLEQCKTFNGPINIYNKPSNIKSAYKFELNEGTNKIEYEVNIFEENGKDYYKLSRISNQSNIDIISKQRSNEVNPVKIKNELSDSVFDVEIEYIEDEGKNSKAYEFTVASIVSDIIIAQNVPQIDTSKNRGSIGFQFYNPEIDGKNIQIVPTGSQNENPEKVLEIDKKATDKGISAKREFDIEMSITGGNNNGKLDAQMDTLGPKGSNGKFVVDKDIFGKNFATDIIVINISDNIQLKNLLINNKKPVCRNSTCKYDEQNDIYAKGEHIFIFDETTNLKISAKMKVIDDSIIGTHSITISAGKSK